jgi:beta-1,4-mannosyl-glycoprotein beta-1,4-N-acetylglucosaminyltransferase
MTKIIDCVTFYNEIEIIKFRLNYLKDVVDYFIISEATKTHSGIDREVIFPTIMEKLPEDMQDKIVYILVDDMPSGDGHTQNWNRENHQRNCVSKGFDKIPLEDDDFIMISDVDEIPRKSALLEVKETNPQAFHLDCYFFYFSIQQQLFESEDKPCIWGSPRGIKYGYYKQLGICCDNIRNTARYTSQFLTQGIADGGWHFSYFGGYDRVKTKLESYAHQEFNDPNFIMKLNSVMNTLSTSTNVDVFNMNSMIKPADLSIFDPELIEDKEFFEYIGGTL